MNARLVMDDLYEAYQIGRTAGAVDSYLVGLQTAATIVARRLGYPCPPWSIR